MKYINTQQRVGLIFALGLGMVSAEALYHQPAYASVQVVDRPGAAVAQTISPGLLEAYLAEPVGTRGQARLGAINWNGDWLEVQ